MKISELDDFGLNEVSDSDCMLVASPDRQMSFKYPLYKLAPAIIFVEESEIISTEPLEIDVTNHIELINAVSCFTLQYSESQTPVKYTFIKESYVDSNSSAIGIIPHYSGGALTSVELLKLSLVTDGENWVASITPIELATKEYVDSLLAQQ